MNNTEFFNKCFEKHNFNELNNIDINMLYNVMLYHFKLFPNSSQSTYFDIGCNSGSFIKVLQHFKIYNVHCFEPHPVLSETTKQKYNYITLNNYCLSNYNGNIDIHFPLHSVGLSSCIQRPIFSTLGTEVRALNVKCEKLDTYCKKNNINQIDFIKIDVEGAEKMVIEGASNLLKEKKIKGGLFEIGETLKDAGTTEQEIATILEGYGYNIVKNLCRNDWYFHL
jgi:FkbM family methyltransferase